MVRTRDFDSWGLGSIPSSAYDSMPEWLMGTTRNRLGFARTGSNPVAVVCVLW